MRRITVSDVACIMAATVLLYMSVLSALTTERLGYQLWTGVLCAVLCITPMIFHQAGVMTLPFAFIALVLVAVFLHGYGVLLMTYDDLVWYDTITHTVSTIAVGMCVFYALTAVQALDHHTSFGAKVPMIFAMIMLTFSVYWEVLELVVDMIWATNMQYSPWDTIRDMVCNTTGSLWIISFSTWFLKPRIDAGFIDSLELHPSLHRFITLAREHPIRADSDAPELPGLVSDVDRK
jgi:hypothetical protein